LNKNTKIWLNYLAGGAISAFLLWGIYGQVMKQANSINSDAWRHPGPGWLLCTCIAMMFVNTSLEGLKWYLLTRSVAPVSYSRAFASYLAGVAFAIITPNRIGEYPGRILYLGKGNTPRYINVSILGITAQLWSVYIFGLVSLIYYNITFPELKAKVALALCVLANIAAAVLYWRFERWLHWLEKFRLLRKFALYGRLLQKITTKRQILVLTISIVRFAIFTAQYLFLLKWMNVNVPIAAGFCMAALFFWIMAVIPSIALTELGIRGSVCIFLFQHYSDNTVGMLAATTGIWLLNLIIPSVIGSLLIIRMRLVS
jgi:Lysylphosphatidylglycerol synthase TM region